MYYSRDYHWTTAGASIAAELVAKIAQPTLSGLTPTHFTTRIEKTEDYTGILAEVAETVCNISIPPEPKMRAVTKGETATGLLDNMAPKVVLAGTSFSAAGRGGYQSGIANFAGALQQAMQQEVLNVSVNGGGVDVALLGYLASETYQGNKPNVIVWEIPAGSSTDIDDPLFYRQTIPAAHGKCDAATAVLSASITSNKPISIQEDKAISGNRYFMQLSFSQPAPAKLDLALGYADGKAEKVTLERSTRSLSTDSYFLELSEAYKAPLTSLAATGITSPAKLAICAQ